MSKRKRKPQMDGIILNSTFICMECGNQTDLKNMAHERKNRNICSACHEASKQRRERYGQNVKTKPKVFNFLEGGYDGVFL